ncbi:MAG: Stp1/IreP family PP2C-type Ser/Thr phosphatase [Acetivibrionales bacterium]|nr:Stp1/IreP family PP2C-type Ser/Thr phosphatase [Clostridiaceae bacterium]
MNYSALSDIGLKREKNEDNWNIVLNREGKPIGFIIADGMGGYLAGEQASRIAVEEMSSMVLECASKKLSDDSIREIITREINNINDRIMDYSLQNLGGLKSGTTLSVGMVIEDNLHIIHVGDCRVYRIREGGISRLTEDHSLVAQLMKEGLISADEANHHPDRNRITRALGFQEDFFPDINKELILPGDIYIFCTDGLYEEMSDEEILNTVINEPRETIAKRLIEKAKEYGGGDNITVIVAWM